MALILNIESSTTNCSVALCNDDKVLAERSINDGYSHAEKLAPFVDDIFTEVSDSKEALEAIAVSAGPGSYTGLRIGTSLAKGLGFALNIPLISVPTLESMLYDERVVGVANENTVLMPMLDARRMEVYTAAYNAERVMLQPLAPVILDEHSFMDEFANQSLVIFGNGAEKFKEISRHTDLKFIEGIWPTAEGMSSVSSRKFARQEFEDLAYFEPNYLKSFQATTPKKLI